MIEIEDIRVRLAACPEISHGKQELRSLSHARLPAALPVVTAVGASFTEIRQPRAPMFDEAALDQTNLELTSEYQQMEGI